MEGIQKSVYACVSPDTIVTDLIPDKIGVEKSRALFWFPNKGVESVFVSTVKHKPKKAMMLLFDNQDWAKDICSLANSKFNEDLEVKQIEAK